MPGVRVFHYLVLRLGPPCSVSGPRRESGTGIRYQVPAFEKPAHGVCIMEADALLLC